MLSTQGQPDVNLHRLTVVLRPRGGEQEARERDAHLPPAAEVVAHGVPLAPRKAEPIEDSRDEGTRADKDIIPFVSRGARARARVCVCVCVEKAL